MKTVPKIATAKIGIVQAIQARQLLLGLQTCKSKRLMGVCHVSNDLLFGDGLEGVQGHQVLVLGVQALEPVHVIGQRHGSGGPRPGFADKIPGGPGPPIGRHPACVRMEVGFIDTVLPGPQQPLFIFSWIFQQSKRLVGVGGDEHPVEAAAMTTGIL